MEIKTSAKYIKTSPRKIRLICDLVRRKKLPRAINEIALIKKQGAADLLTILKTAEANAKQKDLRVEDLYIKEINCSQGPSLKRSIPRSRGRVAPIKKRMSHITVVLSEQPKLETKNAKLKTTNV